MVKVVTVFRRYLKDYNCYYLFLAIPRRYVRVCGGVCSCLAWPQSYDHRPSHPYKTGTEHVGFSPTRETLLAPSAKRREVFGEWREGCELHPTTNRV